MKIYTKKGDLGETDLLYKRISKSDLKIEVVGTIDELISFISFSNSLNTNKEIKEILTNIRIDLSSMMHEVVSKKKINITDEKVKHLETLIDKYDNLMEPLTKFIYFEKDIKSSSLNIARTITRRLERLLVALNEKENIAEVPLKYINRLSDLLFTLARYVLEKDK